MAELDFHPSKVESQNLGKVTENTQNNMQNEVAAAQVKANSNAKAELANQSEAMTKGDKPILPAFDMSRFGDDNKQVKDNNQAAASEQTSASDSAKKAEDAKTNAKVESTVTNTGTTSDTKNQATDSSTNSNTSGSNNTADALTLPPNGKGRGQAGNSAEAPAPVGSEKVKPADSAVPLPASQATTAGSQSAVKP